MWNDQESNVLGGGRCVTPFGLSINDWKDFLIVLQVFLIICL